MRIHQKLSFKLEAIESRLLFSTIYVDASVPGATHNGMNWNTAFVDLQQALSVAAAGDEIHVADGIYKPTSTSNSGIAFNLLNGVSLLGGYEGSGSPNPNLRNPTLFPSTLSGNIGSVSSASDNSTYVVLAANLDSSAVLDGFVIREASGAGVRFERSDAIVRDCTITMNSRSGMLCFESNPLISNCLFLGNTGVIGAGLLNMGSSPDVIGCVFSGNFAYSRGAGMANEYSWPTVTNCTFTANVALDGAPAMWSVDAPSPKIRNSIIWGNVGQTPSQVDINGTPDVAFCDISGNVAGAGNIDADPLFLRKPSSGADKLWGTNDDDYGDLRTYAGSPAVDAANNSDVPGGYVNDLSGNNRFQDVPTAIDSGVGTSPLVDMGAYEAAPVLSAVVSGPAAIVTGRTLQLHAAADSNVAGPLSYQWDLDNDGQFDDAVGTDLTVPTLGLPVSTFAIAMRVTDSSSNSVTFNKAVQVLAPVLYVDRNATGANDGKSWNSAFTSMSDAIDRAVEGITIKVADGTYYPTSGTNRLATFEVKSGVKIYGGYAGAGAADPNSRNILGTPTVFSGDIGISGAQSDNSCHVVSSIGADSTTVLDGVTITQGYATFSDLSFQLSIGAGVYVNRGSPTISNCTILGNIAAGSSGSGGGMYLVDSGSRITDCKFEANQAFGYGHGGALSINGGSTLITDCTFFNNKSLGAGGAVAASSPNAVISGCAFSNNTVTGSQNDVTSGGGALWINGELTLTDCSFNNNSVDVRRGGAIVTLGGGNARAFISQCSFVGNHAGSAGAILNYGTSPVISQCVFADNFSNSGGAIVNSQSSSLPTIKDCTFTRNVSYASEGGGGGGGIFSINASSYILNCKFNGNRGTSYGGAVDAAGGVITLENCTMTGNTAAAGGGVSSRNTVMSLINCTLVNNAATDRGAGAYSLSIPLKVANCIVRANTSPSGIQIVADGQLPSMTFSNVQGGAAAVGNIDADATFNRNPNPGADLTWATADDDYGDLRLRRTSPSIDAGGNTAVSNFISTDLAGNARFIDTLGVRDPGETVDMGAYEFADVLYLFDKAPHPAITIAIGIDLNSTTLDVSDLKLVDRSTGLTLDVSSFATIAYDSSNRTGTWTFSQVLPDGNYRATVLAGTVSDTTGSQLAADINGDFFVLAGDANRDRKVDIQDLAILAGNWAGDGRTFSQGDFNYDSWVDAADLGILAASWQKVLGAPPAAEPVSVVVQARPPKRTAVRVIALLD